MEIDEGLKINTLLKNEIGGPLKVIGSEILGDIPYEAKEYIATKLSGLVYLDPDLCVPLNVIINENASSDDNKKV